MTFLVVVAPFHNEQKDLVGKSLKILFISKIYFVVVCCFWFFVILVLFEICYLYDQFFTFIFGCFVLSFMVEIK